MLVYGNFTEGQFRMWIDQIFGETRARLLRLLRRPPQTINGLAEALGLSTNAVRGHIAALGRDGIVEQTGVRRETGGKPAQLYVLTAEGDELFPKAYAAVLRGLMEEVVRRDGWPHAVELLRAVGKRAATRSGADDAHGRVEAAATALRALGGDVDLVAEDGGWRLQGYACPLSAVTAAHPELCALAHALVEEITGLPVTECCDHAGRPRCAFRIEGRPTVALRAEPLAS